MAVGSYDPKYTVITFTAFVLGLPRTFVLTGFAEDDFLEIDQEEDDVTLAVGADGESAFAQSNNTSARVTLRFLQTANANTTLTEIRNAQRTEIPSIGGVLFIEDLNTGTTITCNNARILRSPMQSYGVEISEREWVFLCANVDMQLKGNAF